MIGLEELLVASQELVNSVFNAYSKPLKLAHHGGNTYLYSSIHFSFSSILPNDKGKLTPFMLSSCPFSSFLSIFSTFHFTYLKCKFSSIVASYLFGVHIRTVFFNRTRPHGLTSCPLIIMFHVIASLDYKVALVKYKLMISYYILPGSMHTDEMLWTYTFLTP